MQVCGVVFLSNPEELEEVSSLSKYVKSFVMDRNHARPAWRDQGAEDPEIT